MREKQVQPVEMRVAVAVAMARLNIIQDVPVYLTGAQWRNQTSRTKCVVTLTR